MQVKLWRSFTFYCSIVSSKEDIMDSSFLRPKKIFSVLLKYCFLERKKPRMNFPRDCFSVRMRGSSVVAFVSAEIYKDRYGKMHMRKRLETLA